MKKLTKPEIRDLLVAYGVPVPALKCISFSVNTKYGGEFTVYPYMFNNVMDIDNSKIRTFRFMPRFGSWIFKEIFT